MCGISLDCKGCDCSAFVILVVVIVVVVIVIVMMMMVVFVVPGLVSKFQYYRLKKQQQSDLYIL